MAKVFGVELTDGQGLYCKLNLPATDYELLDALDKLRMRTHEKPRWEICEHTCYQYLGIYLNDFSLYELNNLARKLDRMSNEERGAFEGLFKMALNKREGPMPKNDLFTYANSVSCCHVMNDITNDNQLGRFYAENGFIAEVDGIPDSIFYLLDFEKIGKEMREAESGVFTRFGYVVQHGALEFPYEDFGRPPQAPSYTLLIRVEKYPFNGDDVSRNTTELSLPANKNDMVKTLESIGAASWDEVMLQVIDSAIPGYPEDLDSISIEELNRFAQGIEDAFSRTHESKIRAIIHAAPINNINEATNLTQKIYDFMFEPWECTPEDVARYEIQAMVPKESVETLLKHINLYRYGLDLIQEYGSTLTPYGLVTPNKTQILEQITSTPQMQM